MDPITHTLFGATLSRTGLNRTTGLATLTIALAAEAPDIDIVTHITGNDVFSFANHRGITHTFVGAPFVAAAVLLLVYLVHRWMLRRNWKPRLPVRWPLLYGYSLLAVCSHLLLDWTNNYGVRPFSPLLHKWYAGDIVFIIEPLMFAMLLLALVIPHFLQLITTDIGGKREPFPGRGLAITALLLIVGMWGLRYQQHAKAVAMLEDRLYEGMRPIRVSAFPYPINPWRWYGVVETANFFQQVDVNTETLEVDPKANAITTFKPVETPQSQAAKASHLGRVYLDWARYPLVEVQSLDEPGRAYRVTFTDLRFVMNIPGVTRQRVPLTASVDLDSNLKVVEERFD